MNEHTIVVRFPEGATPSYSAATEFQGGQVVAVDFDGNRLRHEQELQEALEELLEELDANDLDGLTMHAEPVVRAVNALADAKKSRRGAQ
ncbi:MAG: hypothetical protein CME75_07920 [Halomonas sp.]|nr:hypothetical protein [Halomonas sp.]